MENSHSLEMSDNEEEEIVSQAREIPAAPLFAQNAQELEVSSKPKANGEKRKDKDKEGERKSKALTSYMWLYFVKVGIVDGKRIL
ncbi:unnamed protein product [Trifolium pratense]|uniref:Uncharacterized protein n=1 Tax=Trifolium pratense TaxID=57577 RepID=A0ACB0IXN3_TRIPR|nr:unnamed protein product [Trifolium pratense]